MCGKQDPSAVFQLAEKNFVHEKRLYLVSDDTIDLSCAEFGSYSFRLNKGFRFIISTERYLLCFQLGCKFAQFFADDKFRHLLVHAVEYHYLIQTVAEFRLECLLDCFGNNCFIKT